MEVDAQDNVYAVLFEETTPCNSNGFALIQVDFINYRIEFKSFQYQQCGLSIKKILALDLENYVLIVAERKVADARDVMQSLLIRQNIYCEGDKEIVYFDLTVHQAVTHPLFDAV